MSKEKRRVPKLRFPGFTEDWEQRKLGDIATFSKGNGYSKSDLSASGNPIILYGRLYTNYETTIRNVDTFVELKNKSVISQGGEVIVPASGETAEDISRASVVKNQGVIIGGDLNVIKVNSLLDPIFLALTISNGEQQKELSKRAQGKSVVHLHNSDLQEVNLIFPLLNEQKEISTIFEKMDNIITLHQRKLNNLKLKKKALLQKLFPKNGERYPELRFPGFTDAWEQRKLSELATMNARIGWQNLRTSEFLDDGDYLLITGTDFDNGRIKYSTCHYVEKKRFDQDTKIQLSTGSILITKDGTLGKVALVEELPKPATLNAGVFNVRVKDDAFLSYKYLYHYLKAPFLMKYVTANATGGTIKHLNQSILVDFPIPITEKQEQDRIAKLLDSLESIITLHQRKLDHLQLQKKALLQQMFV